MLIVVINRVVRCATRGSKPAAAQEAITSSKYREAVSRGVITHGSDLKRCKLIRCLSASGCFGGSSATKGSSQIVSILTAGSTVRGGCNRQRSSCPVRTASSPHRCGLHSAILPRQDRHCESA